MFVVAYYLWTRLKENKPVIARVRIVKKVLPHQKALNEIEHIKADRRLISEDQKLIIHFLLMCCVSISKNALDLMRWR